MPANFVFCLIGCCKMKALLEMIGTCHLDLPDDQVLCSLEGELILFYQRR